MCKKSCHFRLVTKSNETAQIYINISPDEYQKPFNRAFSDGICAEMSLDPDRRKLRMEGDDAIVRVIDPCEMIVHPIQENVLLDLGVRYELDLSNKRHAVSLVMKTCACLRILSEMRGLHALGTGRDNNRPDIFRLETGQYTDAGIAFRIDRSQRHNTGLLQ